MSDIDTFDDDAALAAEYALALLSPEEAGLVEERMAVDRVFAELVRRWELDLAEIAEEVGEVRPPPQVLSNLQKELFTEQDAPWWSKLGIVQAILGAAAAGGLAYIAFNTNLLAPVAPQADLHAAIAADDNSLMISAQFFEEESALLIRRDAGEPQAGHVLWLWLVPEGGVPVSLGAVPETGIAQVQLSAAQRQKVAGAMLAVSDEQPGGSATGAPTGAIRAVGPLMER